MKTSCLLLLLLSFLVSCRENKKPIAEKDKTIETRMPGTYFNVDSILASEGNVLLPISTHILDISEFGSKIEKLTEPQKIFYYVDVLEMEVNSGGFDQYFLNSTGSFAHEAVDALKTIKAYETAKVVEDAIAVWPDKKVPKERQARVDFLNRAGATTTLVFDKLDEKFYHGPDSLYALLVNYVKSNKKGFE